MNVEDGLSNVSDPGTAARAQEVEGLLQKALEHGEEGDWEGMVDVLQKGLEEYEDDPFLLCWLGVAERELGMDGVAYDHFRKCLEQQPQDPYVLATAGNAVAEFDDPDAEAALRTAAMTAPELPLARWMYGAYLAREGQLEKALEHLEAARELAPDDGTIAFELGVALALGDDLDRAADRLAEAVRLDHEDGWARVVFGLVLLELEAVEEAATELEAGARLRPDDVEAQLLASLALGAEGYEGRALEMLERARQRSQEGGDKELAVRVEDAVMESPDAARRFLVSRLAPLALRERLMTRP